MVERQDASKKSTDPGWSRQCLYLHRVLSAVVKPRRAGAGTVANDQREVELACRRRTRLTGTKVYRRSTGAVFRRAQASQERWTLQVLRTHDQESRRGGGCVHR